MVRSCLRRLASLREDTLYSVLASTPVKLRLVTKLTTPATASAPYTAEAPPVTRSTRSSSDTGTLLVSTTPPSVAGTMRLPLNSTSVRLLPMPRRSMEAVPLEPLLMFGPMAG